MSAVLLPAFAGPKLNEVLTAVGGAGAGESKANGFFSAGAGGAGAPNEKGTGVDTNFSSAALGCALSEKPGVDDESCVPKRGLGASITGAGAGTGDVEGAGEPNEKALFDGSAIARTGAGCPNEKAGLDGSVTGAGTTGVPKLNGVGEGAAPKRGDSLASGSATFEVPTAGEGAPNENGEEDAAGRRAAAAGGTGDGVDISSTEVETSLGGAGALNDTPVVVAEVPKIEVLVEGEVGPNMEVVAGTVDGAAVT